MPTSPLSARRFAPLAVAALILIAAGCGSSGDKEAPAACLATSDAYIQALQAAPGTVRLEDEVPISDCLVATQGGGQLQNIGQELVVAATKLNAEAREDPSGPAAVQLGYLVGAVSKGADLIHTDLVRRLNASAQFSESGETLPVAFQRAFSRGYAAGRQSG
jgi:hypothetical protein